MWSLRLRGGVASDLRKSVSMEDQSKGANENRCSDMTIMEIIQARLKPPALLTLVGDHFWWLEELQPRGCPLLTYTKKV